MTRNHTVGRFDERWRLDGSDRSLTSRGRWTLTVDYAVPGDTTSRTNTYTGGPRSPCPRPARASSSTNIGRVNLNWDESEVLAVSGRQDMLRDFEGAIAVACAAFAR